jgi:hypothetical protein
VGSSKTHPHIDQPTEAELSRLIESKPPQLGRLYLETHRLVLEILPEVVYSVDCHDSEIGYGARQYGYDGWGMAALTPYTNWISLGFTKGTALADPDGLLEGTGTTMRHMKLRSAEQLMERRDAIRRFLEAAATINQG